MLLLFLGVFWVLLLGMPFLLLLVWVPRGSRCPQCQEATALLRSPLLRLVPWRVESRWCLSCGWEGFSRPRTRPRWFLEWERERDRAYPDSAPWEKPDHR
jgi:hypothetical protein